MPTWPLMTMPNHHYSKLECEKVNFQRASFGGIWFGIQSPITFGTLGVALWLRPVQIAVLLLGNVAFAQPLENLPVGPLQSSRVIEVAGQVEYAPANQNVWRAATNGLLLRPADRLRTRTQSRAAVQFSDRSVLRLNENTTLEIQPPRRMEMRRFRLLGGSIFFFHRERPAELEFETPVVSGSIRGTEFVLETSEADGTTRLALLDGLVDLAANNTTIVLRSGEQARIAPGQVPLKSPLLEVRSIIQWALYYPAVVNPEDLDLTQEDRSVLSRCLADYRNGDLLSAHSAISKIATGSESRELFRAALDLSVGRVDEAEAQLARGPATTAVAKALREVIDLVRGNTLTNSLQSSPQTASEWLARSYSLQAQFHLPESLAAAQHATALAPDLGFAHARVAELLLAFEERPAALAALDRALLLAPRLASGQALRGFVFLERDQAPAALDAFDQAIALDAALGNAWLGRGLTQQRLGHRVEALRAFQTAAALEPRRAIARSYLGKAFSAAGETMLAEKEFRLAKELDPGDPTAWLYSALFHWQQNRPNTAVRELKHSAALNDNEQLFRSRLFLDRDRAVRSANLAALFGDVGLPEASLLSAARAVNEDYVNFAGHLFLANSYQVLEDPNRFDLRFETTRQSELLVANLLAPAGAGNLSQLASQQEHLQFFDPRPFGASSFTEYRSSGDWQESASFFGNLDGFSYALDLAYQAQHGQEINDWRERTDLALQIKQRLSPQDEFYFQLARSTGSAGDIARHYDPNLAIAGLHVSETQEPNLFAGWHHAWSPSSHTLFLVSRLTDSFHLHNPETTVLFLRPDSLTTTSVSTPPGFDSQLNSDFTLYSAEIQQIWQGRKHTLVAGGRYQTGELDSDATLNRLLTGLISRDHINEPLRRANAYVYDYWKFDQSLQLVAGLSYDRLTFPQNSDLLPLTDGKSTRDRLAPKAGFLVQPWSGGQWRGAYTRSLGGLFFDNSVRLEPTQVAGFNQAFRSVLPESIAGLVPGTAFETASLGVDQSFSGGTYFGLEADWLRSNGGRTVGVLANPLPAPLPGSVSSTRQTLEFRERDLSAYAVQLLGEGFSFGARYRLSEGHLDGRFPQIPDQAAGLDSIEQPQRSVLQEITVSLNYQHPLGFFGQWETAGFHQDNGGYIPARPGDAFWQHNLWLGYRLPHRLAEVRLGVLNLTDQDYHLNPLNLYRPLPRGRTAVVSLQLNF